MKRGQKTAPRMIRGLEKIPGSGRLKELGLFSFPKRRVRGNNTKAKVAI